MENRPSPNQVIPSPDKPSRRILREWNALALFYCTLLVCWFLASIYAGVFLLTLSVQLASSWREAANWDRVPVVIENADLSRYKDENGVINRRFDRVRYTYIFDGKHYVGDLIGFEREYGE